MHASDSKYSEKEKQYESLFKGEKNVNWFKKARNAAN